MKIFYENFPFNKKEMVWIAMSSSTVLYEFFNGVFNRKYINLPHVSSDYFKNWNIKRVNISDLSPAAQEKILLDFPDLDLDAQEDEFSGYNVT